MDCQSIVMVNVIKILVFAFHPSWIPSPNENCLFAFNPLHSFRNVIKFQIYILQTISFEMIWWRCSLGSRDLLISFKTAQTSGCTQGASNIWEYVVHGKILASICILWSISLRLYAATCACNTHTHSLSHMCLSWCAFVYVVCVIIMMIMKQCVREPQKIVRKACYRFFIIAKVKQKDWETILRHLCAWAQYIVFEKYQKEEMNGRKNSMEQCAALKNPHTCMLIHTKCICTEITRYMCTWLIAIKADWAGEQVSNGECEWMESIW